MLELVATPLEKLVEIPGIGEKTAEKVLATAQEYVAAHPAEPPASAAAEMAFTPEMEAEAGGAADPLSAGTPADTPQDTAPGATEGEPNA